MDRSRDQSASDFVSTHWSLVLRAGQRGSREAEEALALLCQSYWYPLYVYVRRRGHGADEAGDLTQEFFTRLLEKDYLQDVDRGRGKFRAFLLAACQHFLSNEHDRVRAVKRGGRHRLLSLDLQGAEDRYLLEPAHDATPEKLFERRWALTLLDQVLARLREEWTAAGKDRVFDVLKGYLTAGADAVPYRTAAEELGLSEGAVKVAVHRLRKRYRELLREEIERTLDEPDQVEDEIRDLFAALSY